MENRIKLNVLVSWIVILNQDNLSKCGRKEVVIQKISNVESKI